MRYRLSNGKETTVTTGPQRLANRTFGRLKGAALDQTSRIVRDNGGLDISGEYGSIEISDGDFEASQKVNANS